MASTITSAAFMLQQSSPLARATSPFKNPRTPPPPCTPRHTAKLWDEYEKRAIENSKRRETTCGSSNPQATPGLQSSGSTILDIIKSYDPCASAAASPNVQLGFSPSAHYKSRRDRASSTTVAICKTCKQSITSTSGICEKCKKTIILSTPSGETTPPLSPSCRNFASTDLPKLHKELKSGASSPVTSINSSPKRKSHRRSSARLTDPPIRLASLKPLLNQDSSPRQSHETGRPRKVSLIDPNEPLPRLQISRKPVSRALQPPISPTTPPSTSHSHTSGTQPSTRPFSLANITTPPQYVQHTGANYTRHVSATPSELSTLYPYISRPLTTTSLPSVCHASYSIQNATSAWDDWDSDEEEKAGLVRYWRGRKWRGSRGSMERASGRESGERRGSANGSAGAGGASREDSSVGETDTSARRKRRGFVRVISCGCDGNE